jgi:hypothetical protein
LSKPALRSSTRLDEAEWLRLRLRPPGSVASIVPDGFPAYLRILHPARGPHDQPVTWASVAARSGRTMHRLVQFHAIARPTDDRPATAAAGWSAPDTGNLSPDLLSTLCKILAQHTSTKDSCFFCLWDGHGWLPDKPSRSELIFTSSTDTWEDLPSTPIPPAPVPPPFPAELANQSKLDLPLRRYYLFEGALDAASQFGWTLSNDCFVPQSPNLFWPQDHAWCVASEIDLYCTLIAGSESLAEVLLADPGFEAWRVLPGDPITHGSDEINTTYSV